VTEQERSSRSVWDALIKHATGDTLGSLELTTARARVCHKLGSYKYLESCDTAALEWYKKAEAKYKEVVDATEPDDEAARTQAKAKKHMCRLYIDWGMALQEADDFGDALIKYRKGVELDDCNMHPWVKQNRIPECERKVGAGPSVAASSGYTDVEVTGARTWEERNAEGRKHSIDLDEEAGLPTKRLKAVSQELEMRMTKARSLCTAASEAKGS
jgi:hypothetical protein